MLSKVTVLTEKNSQVEKEVVEETLTAAKVKEAVKTESIAILEFQDEHAEELPSDKVITDEATIVKTEELSVADKTVNDKIEDITRPVEHEYVTMQENAQNLLESAKTKNKIMLRRKTVEPDLEKVVCLSKESSDSECNGPTSYKPVHDLPALDEDANLIKIATEVLSAEGQPLGEQVAVKQSQLDKLYAGLKDLAQERRAKLDEALQLFLLNRDVGDLEQWIADREVVASSHELGRDAGSVSTLQRKHQNFMQDLQTLQNQVQQIQEQSRVVSAWASLQMVCEQRKGKLADTGDLFRFFNLVRTLMQWLDNVVRQVNTSEKPRDVGGVELLMSNQKSPQAKF
ncbi:spectrin beta chain-like [Dendroctonus ponderosae]|uniref:spectrin beta chain-like n=1 Tax=Dendroctonus ponderosae TaxID=77166 RepID=UPI00203501A4|nr:spectrin beta chain-like [Dendroctonus ponderosae]